MPQIEIKILNDTIDFSRATDEEKEKFVEKIMQRQAMLIEKYLKSFGFAGLINDFIKNINIAKIVANLSGVMTGRQIINIIMEVLKDDLSKTAFN